MKLIISVVSTSSAPNRTRSQPGINDQAAPAVTAAAVPAMITNRAGPVRHPKATARAAQAPT